MRLTGAHGAGVAQFATAHVAQDLRCVSLSLQGAFRERHGVAALATRRRLRPQVGGVNVGS